MLKERMGDMHSVTVCIFTPSMKVKMGYSEFGQWCSSLEHWEGMRSPPQKSSGQLSLQ